MRQVLALCSTEKQPESTSEMRIVVEQGLQELGIALHFAPPFDEGSLRSMQQQFTASLQEFWNGVDTSRVVLDMTPGKKSMILALAGLAPRGSSLARTSTSHTVGSSTNSRTASRSRAAGSKPPATRSSSRPIPRTCSPTMCASTRRTSRASPHRASRRCPRACRTRSLRRRCSTCWRTSRAGEAPTGLTRCRSCGR